MPTLHYVGDPMCSWCWGFREAWQRVRAELGNASGGDALDVRLVLGGLAPDSDEPMPDEMRRYVQEQWRLVEERTGARFVHRFWRECRPRRSTYPACRAVVAARAQAEPLGWQLFDAIQHAYYLEARNPSDRDVLVDAARGIDGLDLARFEAELDGRANRAELEHDFALRTRLGVRSFPSLVLEDDSGPRSVSSGCDEAAAILERIRAR